MSMNRRDAGRSGERGFALVLALLALLLLTFLGLTLAVTTSTELQIATNYRWSQQAVYVAEAGIEVGKAVLRGVSWGTVLQQARVGTPWTGLATPGAMAGTPGAAVNGLPRRDYEGWQCDNKGAGMGYGRVLTDGAGGTTYQYVSSVPGVTGTLNGAFTLWVRRPLYIRPDGTITDWGAVQTLPDDSTTPVDDDNLVLVAEGIAPFVGAAMSSLQAQSTRAVHVVEVAVSRQGAIGNLDCEFGRTGQQGLGPEGANFGGCNLKPDALNDAMRGATGPRGTLNDTGAQ